jgi:signal transduction histidine kinase
MKAQMAIAAAVLVASSPAFAECVPVKYREGCVPLEKLECKATVSSFVHEVCYDKKNQYMVILLRDTRFHYCNIQSEVVSALIGAESVGKLQVMRNLIVNALEAMDAVTDRAPVLTVKSTAHDSESVLITVEDSGTGIEPKD